MSQHAMCKTAQDGVSFTAIEMNGVSHAFVVAAPRGGGTLTEQTRNALEGVRQVMRNLGGADSVVHLTVFLADGKQIAACRQVVRDFFGPHLPATSYIPQPPCDGKLVSVEALGLGDGHERVTIERHSDQLVVVKHDGLSWVYVDQAVPRTSAQGVYEKTLCSYQLLRRLLPEGGARLDQVLRTWLYLGGIVDDDGPDQRYKELNRARADIYDNVAFMAEHLPDGHAGPTFPASTGIGATGRSITISALALVSDRDDVVSVPLENPRQTAAYDYATSYSPKSPKFSRGLAVSHDRHTTLFISGTASITHSETRHLGDVAAQTEETLDNIAALISEENLARHGLPGEGTTLEGMALARAYIKHLDGYPAVRAVCERRLAGVPLTYVVADECRPDLLVEIEGIAFAQRARDDGAAAAFSVHRCGTRTHAARQSLELQSAAHLCPSTCPERLTCKDAVRSSRTETGPKT